MTPGLKVATAPATIPFSYDTSAVSVISLSMTFGIPIGQFGDGYSGSSIVDSGAPVAVTYTQPGLYSYGMTVKDSSGQTRIDSGSILIMDPWEQRGVMRALLGYVKAKLQMGDAAGASLAFDQSVQSSYLTLFQAYGSNMPAASQILGFVANGFLSSNHGEFILIRDNADQTRSGFPFRVSRGSDGVWRISDM
jgi:hypothetical protein